MDILGSLRQFTKINAICTDNMVFRLHYKVTFGILFACSVLVTARQYIGDPIDCIVEGVPSNIMDTFCWFSSTFTLPDQLYGVVGRDIVRPGLGNAAGNTMKYHQYYQWVCFVLAFQAVLFYVPRYLWKITENGRIKMLSDGINQPIIDDEVKEMRVKILIAFIKDHLKQHNQYFFHFIICEFLNFCNVLFQIYLMNVFLDGDFLMYGIDVLLNGGKISAMDRVFPKMTKCTFHQYGPSGSIRLHDGLCVLAVNIINEKIYIFLWFWFLILAIITGLSMIYRLIVVSVPKVRYYLLCARARWSSSQDILFVLKHFEIGDWFFFYQLSKNIDPIVFKEICQRLAMSLNKNYEA